MKNSELPANPANLDISEYKGTINCEYNKPLTGLTKREHLAALAMQALISSGDCQPLNDKTTHHMVSMASVLFADALLTELEK
jgi:hypothetical protein